MATEEVTIRLDPEAAKVYRETSQQDRWKLDMILSLRLKALARPRRSLSQIMDAMSEQAERNGLTPEILDSILNER